MPYINLLRPQQYVKNLFIFIPLFFSHQFSDQSLLSITFFAFLAFSFSASAIYILNDYHDIEEDRQHPKKRTRPLASGEISIKKGLMIMIFLFILGVSIMASLSLKAVAFLGIYILLNIAYSLYLKHIAIVDVTIIAIGFVLRLFVGSAVTGITLSMWIVLMTFLLALFMAFAKRRDDVLIYLDTGKKMRKVIDGYNLQFLDAAMVIMASVVIVSYTLYTTTPKITERLDNQYIYLTTFFVILGILRYLQISFVYKDSGSPTTIILRDKFIQISVLGWIFAFSWIIYL